MKKIIYYAGIAFIAISIASCGKTTKGKITNEWRVVSYTEETVDGDTSYTISAADAPATPNNLTIDKDGTWTWKSGYTASGYIFGGSVYITNTTTTTQNGTWSFIGKTKGDDFEKNERLMFTILSESTVKSQTSGSPMFPDTTVTTSQTYLTGEKVMIYTVTKSTKKDLELKSESSHFNSTDGQTYSKKITVNLEAKK